MQARKQGETNPYLGLSLPAQRRPGCIPLTPPPPPKKVAQKMCHKKRKQCLSDMDHFCPIFLENFLRLNCLGLKLKQTCWSTKQCMFPHCPKQPYLLPGSVSLCLSILCPVCNTTPSVLCSVCWSLVTVGFLTVCASVVKNVKLQSLGLE